jgi:ribosome maturation factor RimP
MTGGVVKRPLFGAFLLVLQMPAARRTGAVCKCRERPERRGSEQGQDPVSARENKLQALLQPTVQSLGFELWGLEYLSQGRQSVLRLYIESESGVQVDDCARVSEQVGALLDVEEPLSGDYVLEVSSPGIDRRLFTLEQCAAFAGEPVEVRLRRPFDGRRRFRGVLRGVEQEDLVVLVDDHEYLLPFGDIDRAQLQLRL